MFPYHNDGSLFYTATDSFDWSRFMLEVIHGCFTVPYIWLVVKKQLEFLENRLRVCEIETQKSQSRANNAVHNLTKNKSNVMHIMKTGKAANLLSDKLANKPVFGDVLGFTKIVKSDVSSVPVSELSQKQPSIFPHGIEPTSTHDSLVVSDFMSAISVINRESASIEATSLLENDYAYVKHMLATLLPLYQKHMEPHTLLAFANNSKMFEYECVRIESLVYIATNMLLEVGGGSEGLPGHYFEKYRTHPNWTYIAKLVSDTVKNSFDDDSDLMISIDGDTLPHSFLSPRLFATYVFTPTKALDLSKLLVCNTQNLLEEIESTLLGFMSLSEPSESNQES